MRVQGTRKVSVPLTRVVISQIEERRCKKIYHLWQNQKERLIRNIRVLVLSRVRLKASSRSHEPHPSHHSLFVIVGPQKVSGIN